jgi:hypothetical protein
MTIVIRRLGATHWSKLRQCGHCRIGFGEVVGVFPSAVSKVVWIGGDSD